MPKNILLVLSILSLSAASLCAHAKEVTNDNIVPLVAVYSDGMYAEYQAYFDKSSLKKLPNNRVLFNMMVTGLSIDRSITYDNPATTDGTLDTVDLSDNKMVVSSEIDCNTKDIKPVKFTYLDESKGEKVVSEAIEDDKVEATSEQDKMINAKIFILACK